jgi:hypothetical protein
MGALISIAVTTTALLTGTIIGLTIGGAVTACACGKAHAFVPREHEAGPKDQDDSRSKPSPRPTTGAARS